MECCNPIFDSASSLARAIRARKISAVDALEHLLERQQRLHPLINAVVAHNNEAARLRAIEADRALDEGLLWGPLHGLPITIKDCFDVVGLPTVCGDRGLFKRKYQPQRNAAAVQRLIDAGAIVYGKTNVPRMAQDIQTFNDVYGTSNNPWNTAHTPGGSSGGAAAAVAAGLTAFELGSDIGGSIRTPAHWCGIYGHKPSWGTVPMTGHIPGPPGTLSEPDLAVAGPLARSAEDLRLIMETISGASALEAKGWKLELPESRHQQLGKFRVACRFDDSFCPVDSSTRDCLNTVANSLEQAGAAVSRDVKLPRSLEHHAEIYQNLLNAVIGAGMPEKNYRRMRSGAKFYRWAGQRESPLGRFLAGATQSHKAWARANEQREKLRHDWEGFFREYDILLMPVTPTAAIHHDNEGSILTRRILVDGVERPYQDQFAWIGPATTALLPATVAPTGLTPGGLPIGIQIVAPFMEDYSSIEFARLLAEAGIGGFRKPPISELEVPHGIELAIAS